MREVKINELEGLQDFKGYSILEDGTVRSYIIRGYNGTGERFNWNEYRIIHPSVKSNGYKHLTLHSVKGENKTLMIHRLLSLAFVENPNDEDFVNHINGNKLDNRLENLEWVSFERNVQHAFEIGTNHRFANGANKKVKQIDGNGKVINIFQSVRDASNHMGFKNGASAISRACRGKQKTSGGYRWEFLDEIA